MTKIQLKLDSGATFFLRPLLFLSRVGVAAVHLLLERVQLALIILE